MAAAQQMADIIPGSTLINLPDLSHFAMWQDPATFNATALGYLDAKQPPGVPALDPPEPLVIFLRGNKQMKLRQDLETGRSGRSETGVRIQFLESNSETTMRSAVSLVLAREERESHPVAAMLNYVALFSLIFVTVFLFYAVIAVHDIPYEIAKKRKHPHQDAIHVAGWVSLLTLHVIWPFLWIWATLYREDRGWGMSNSGVTGNDQDGEKEAAVDPQPVNEELRDHVASLSERIEQLEARLEEKEAKA
jgi:hypothetical protein